MNDLSTWGPYVVTAIFAAGGAYAAVRMETRFLWRKIEEHERDIEHLRTKTEAELVKIVSILLQRKLA